MVAITPCSVQRAACSVQRAGGAGRGGCSGEGSLTSRSTEEAAGLEEPTEIEPTEIEPTEIEPTLAATGSKNWAGPFRQRLELVEILYIMFCVVISGRGGWGDLVPGQNSAVVALPAPTGQG